jgi:hypothetical protein
VGIKRRRSAAFLERRRLMNDILVLQDILMAGLLVPVVALAIGAIFKLMD